MAITTDEEYPVAGEAVTLSTSTGDNDVAEWSLTSVPAESALTLGKIVNAQGVAQSVFTPDVPGVYAVSCIPGQELCPDPARGVYVKRLTPETLSLNVGQALTLPINVLSGHNLTLRLTVVGSTVRAAELTNARTTIAANAILDTTVAAAVGALVGVAVSSLDYDLPTNVATLRTNWEGHRLAYSPSGSSVHNLVDPVNITIGDAPRTNAMAIPYLQHLAQRITTHMVPGILDGGWHDEDDVVQALAVAPTCRTLAQATVLFADLAYRCFQRHRGQVSSPAASHNTADLANSMGTAPPLSAAIVAILDYLASAAPTTPSTESSGVALATSRFGFA